MNTGEIQRIDVSFPSDGGIELAGWLFLPKETGPRPAITMSHGYAGTIHHGLEPFARAFAQAGFVVLVHDHRSFGGSGGQPRQDINPWQQVVDWRRAISYLETRPEVDPKRIGLWGTSYSGGHALVLGATDRRLRAVVAQVPTISGYEAGLRRANGDALVALEQSFDDDERAQLKGEQPRYLAVVSADPKVPAAYRTPDAVSFSLEPNGRPLPPGVWENKVTLRSTRLARMYEPGAWIARVSPTPLLLVVARDDSATPTDLALAAYERALQPKRLVVLPGVHYEIYQKYRDGAIAAELAWFKEHL
ncbi:alpha/beta hydrolase [Cupriavidus lacunae]|uniref:Alpha/beta hydrolase n=1 Tax=Cupriavidus lacunae TaxID=2666307 RepID=A0A370P206_9BURK|nr:alpha/beta fold hydrolase [Cupriavidus lacunae]RDK11899.1 alpha/beta hydrolase [Cupriavidus lacunae]